jgi:hypothetical protein
MKRTPANPPPTSATILKDDLNVDVRLQPKARKFYAGGPVELELILANNTPRQVHYLTGSTHGRPAFLRFSAELRAPDLKLCDPVAAASLQPDGIFARPSLDPGQVVKRTLVLNQFVNLEEARDAIAEGRSAKLVVRWQYFPGLSQTDGLTPAAEPAEGEFEVTLVRNDDHLRETIALLNSQLTNDSKDANFDSARKRDAAIVLISLRIHEVALILRGLADFPDFEIRSMAQQALREIENEPKRRNRCD